MSDKAILCVMRFSNLRLFIALS